ncbi:MAG: c-type cytochrome domain-containing protein [Flavobacteriales bacterium]|jgi:hypothetical protein
MKKAFVFFALVTGILVACQHHPDEIIEDATGGNNGGGGGTENPDPCDPDTVYFQNTILPLLVSSCAQPECHDAITHEEDLRLYDYAHIMEIVEAGNPNGSELIDVLYENGNDMMPPADAGGPLSQEQKDLIALWISQGAQNNACIADCDPAQFTFSAVIQPMMQNNCQGCHSGSNPDGNLSLTNYDQIYASAMDGSLINSLLGTNDYTLMPYQSNALVQCKIDQVQAWIDAGAPNN